MSASQPFNKQTAYWGVSWEEAYGYPQARRVGNEIYVSGQFNHDEEGNLVAPAPLDDDGKPSDFSSMVVRPPFLLPGEGLLSISPLLRAV